MRPIHSIWLLILTCSQAFALTGSELMHESIQRHQLFPFVYEEQTMVMTDKKATTSVRTLQRYTRMDEGQGIKTLLVFKTPKEVEGVSLLATRSVNGIEKNQLFLPAFSGSMMQLPNNKYQNQLLGSDFTLADLSPEDPEQFIYTRMQDTKKNGVDYFIVKSEPLSQNISKQLGYSHKRHRLRKDNLFIVQSDYYNHDDRIIKRLTRHALSLIDGSLWRANMTLMENFKEQHTTLLKVSRRIFSEDYVPEKLFSPEHVMNTYSYKEENEPAH